MTPAKFTAAAIFALSASVAAALAMAPSLAQAPRAAEQIMLVQGDATAPVTVLGQVAGEYHQKSMFSKISPRDELDKQLRAAALKLGADAVINISYDMNSPMMSKKGQLAKGTAVKFAAAPVAAAPAAPVQVAAAPPPAAPPVAQPAAPPAAAPIVAPPIVTPPVIAAPVPAAAPFAPAATTTAAIALAEGDAPGGRAYAVLGAVTATAKPTLEKAPKQVLDEDFRARAAAMGADAVIMIRYDATGASASGVAVKYK